MTPEPKYPLVLGQDGPGRYLVAVDHDWGRILDQGTGHYYVRQLIGTILVMSGPWQALDHPVTTEQLAGWVAAAHDDEGDLTADQQALLAERARQFAENQARNQKAGAATE